MKLNVDILVLLLDLYCIHQVSGEIHSWKAYFTSTTGLSEFPEFVALNVLDNEVMGYFDSKNNRFVNKQTWIAEALGQEYEEQQTNALIGHAVHFKNNIRTAMERFNQTQGVHTFQSMHGCEWDDVSKATNGFSRYGYDGEDFVSLDLKNMRYIATTPQSLISKRKWDSERALLESENNYYHGVCIDWLKKYVQYGSSTLERKVRPEVTLLQKYSSSEVVCHATGFYPDGVIITWKRDGVEIQNDVNVGETLPNADGTFQKRAVLTVSAEELKNWQYTCEVAHKSGETIILDETEIQRSNPGSVPLGAIIGVVVALIVLIAIIAIVAWFIVLKKKKKAGFTRASTDESSQSSSEKA